MKVYALFLALSFVGCKRMSLSSEANTQSEGMERCLNEAQNSRIFSEYGARQLCSGGTKLELRMQCVNQIKNSRSERKLSADGYIVLCGHKEGFQDGWYKTGDCYVNAVALIDKGRRRLHLHQAMYLCKKLPIIQPSVDLVNWTACARQYLSAGDEIFTAVQKCTDVRLDIIDTLKEMGVR